LHDPGVVWWRRRSWTAWTGGRKRWASIIGFAQGTFQCRVVDNAVHAAMRCSCGRVHAASRLQSAQTREWQCCEVGLVGLVAMAWASSEDRRRVPWRIVGAGIELPAVAAAFLLLHDAVGA
jgi:hypothetical protein